MKWWGWLLLAAALVAAGGLGALVMVYWIGTKMFRNL